MATYKVLGPCSLTWNGIACGNTLQGVLIQPRHNWKPITDDLHGEEPADYIMAGKSCIVACTLLDTAALTLVKWFDASIPLSNLYTANGAASAIGVLASAVAKTLDITEGDTSTHWIALKAVPVDPTEIVIASTQEYRFNASFLILPDTNNKLFSTVPTYLTGAVA